MSGHCRVMVAELNKAIEEGGLALRLRMTDLDSPPSAILDMICLSLSDENVAVAEEEFKALPAAFLTSFLAAFHDTHVGGKKFELVSAPPELPIDAARNGRVEWRIVYDNEGVKMIVSHVHGRHADWFTAAAVESA